MELKEAKLGDVIPTVATDLDQIVPCSRCRWRYCTPIAAISRRLCGSPRARVVATVDSILRVGSGTECILQPRGWRTFYKRLQWDNTVGKEPQEFSGSPRAERDTCSEPRVATATSKLCGRVVPTDATGSIDSQILLVRLGRKSPGSDNEAD